MSDLRPILIALSVLSIGLGLGGCARQPVSPYVPPDGPQSARLLMRADLQPGDAYGVYLFAGAQDCTQMQRVAYGRPGQDPSATRIAAERLNTVEVLISKADHRACHVRWSFIPHTGRSYVVSALSKPESCSAVVLDASDPDHLVVEPSQRRRDAPGAACVPMAQARPIRHDGDGGEPAAPPAGWLSRGVEDADLQGLIGRP